MEQLIRYVAKDIVKNRDLMDIIIYYFTMDRTDDARIAEIKAEVDKAIVVLDELRGECDVEVTCILYNDYKTQLEEIKLSI